MREGRDRLCPAVHRLRALALFCKFRAKSRVRVLAHAEAHGEVFQVVGKEALILRCNALFFDIGRVEVLRVGDKALHIAVLKDVAESGPVFIRVKRHVVEIDRARAGGFSPERDLCIFAAEPEAADLFPVRRLPLRVVRTFRGVPHDLVVPRARNAGQILRTVGRLDHNARVPVFRAGAQPPCAHIIIRVRLDRDYVAAVGDRRRGVLQFQAAGAVEVIGTALDRRAGIQFPAVRLKAFVVDEVLIQRDLLEAHVVDIRIAVKAAVAYGVVPVIFRDKADGCGRVAAAGPDTRNGLPFA